MLNRGFKTEEQIELSLNPQLHYELIGSNNPDAVLNGAKLAIPRIGSADDCSVLLQADNGKFSHEDIVNCLSKESKASVTTKLEDVPVTAQQRVDLVSFMVFLMVAGTLTFIGMDKLLDALKPEAVAQIDPVGASPPPPKPDLQGWNIRDIYEDNPLYEQIVAKELQITIGQVTRRGRNLTIPIAFTNGTSEPVALSAWSVSPVDDSGIEYEKRRVNDRLIFPNVSFSHSLMAVTGDSEAERAVLVHIFLTREDGDSLKATRMIRSE